MPSPQDSDDAPHAEADPDDALLRAVLGVDGTADAFRIHCRDPLNDSSGTIVSASTNTSHSRDAAAAPRLRPGATLLQAGMMIESALGESLAIVRRTNVRGRSSSGRFFGHAKPLIPRLGRMA